MLTNQPLRDWEVAACAIVLSATTGIGIIAGFCFPWKHPLRWYCHAAAGGTAIAGLIFCQKDIKFTRRQKKLDRAEENCFSVTVQAAEQQYISQFQPQVNPTHGGIPPMNLAYLQSLAEAVPEPELTSVDSYDWVRIPRDASGCLVAGPSGYGKTSIGAGVLVGRLTQSKPAEVIALDIHASRNRIWGDLGFPRVIDDAETIYQVAKWLIDETETRKKQSRHNIIVLLDEVNDLLTELEFQDGKKNGERVKTLIYCIRKLSNGRKFGIALIVFGQSHNCDAIGIDSKFRNNFTVVLVGESARYEVGQNFKKEDIEKQIIDSVAYPCCLTGNVPLTLAVHPTHGEYAEYEKEGLPPKNLIQPNFIMDGWLIPDFGDIKPSTGKETNPPNHIPSPSDFNLEKDIEPSLPELPEPKDKKPSEGEALATRILEWCISKGGEITLGYLKNSTRWAKEFSDEILLAAFSALQENGLAEYVVEEKVAGKISHILRVRPPK